MSNYRPRASRFGDAQVYRAACVSRDNLLWSRRDWEVFRASCAQSPRQRERSVGVVRRFRSGEPVSLILLDGGLPPRRGRISRQLVYSLLAAEDLRDARAMRLFFGRRRNLGRPIDMGGPRDEWVERDVIDEQD